ncbi:MFS transporter [Herminiimonas sp. KBW02]|uniref:MFS transporter n=1 Tax=Herminiimonas sp. KBW02 TaxID=2153363 RepID=UPI000F5A2342|nr:MFS transporter [Herminiimonas sp. KBW02]RQO34025.1 MFS transporter [Herminiimonas sp. KBW02]
MSSPDSPIPAAVSAVPPKYLNTSALLLMALASGLCAGGNYFNQPLLRSIALSFDVSETTAALTVTMAQVSYALGLLLLVPLGDKLERRGLAVTLMLLAATGQFISGFSFSIAMLFVGIIMSGLFSVAAQIMVPMAATLSDPGRSGRAVGLVMSGLLIGILTARSLAGLLSELGGWTTVYRVAGVVMLLVALALWHLLPPSRNPARVSYLQVLRSMTTLIGRYPRLRSRSLMGALTFASVSVLFSTMALLLSGPNHGLSDAGIGLVGLVGIAGALMASVAGRLADKGFGVTTSITCLLLLLLAWVCFWLGSTSLMWFLVGMLVIDLALQGLHITNQSVVLQLEPQARSRLNAVYMTSYFIGAASGSALGSLAWRLGGWHAICIAGVLLTLLAGVVFLYDRKLARAELKAT